MDKVEGRLRELKEIHGSFPKVCDAIGVPQSINASMYAILNDGYVSPAQYNRIKRALFPGDFRPQPRPCPNAAQVQLFNELGCSTWSEVIDAGLERLQRQKRVKEQFNEAMEQVKEQMEHA